MGKYILEGGLDVSHIIQTWASNHNFFEGSQKDFDTRDGQRIGQETV